MFPLDILYIAYNPSNVSPYLAVIFFMISFEMCNILTSTLFSNFLEKIIKIPS